MCLKLYAEIRFSRCPSYPSHLREEIPDSFLLGDPFLKMHNLSLLFIILLSMLLICLSQIKGFFILFQHKNLSKKKNV
jgi:hypothetical protein